MKTTLKIDITVKDVCAEFVYEHESCEHWQNHDNEILGDSK